MNYIVLFLISLFLINCNKNSVNDKSIPFNYVLNNKKITLLYINRNSCISCIKKIENKMKYRIASNDLIIFTNDMEISENYKVNFDTNQTILNQLSNYNIIKNLSFIVTIEKGKIISLKYITPESKDTIDF